MTPVRRWRCAARARSAPALQMDVHSGTKKRTEVRPAAPLARSWPRWHAGSPATVLSSGATAMPTLTPRLIDDPATRKGSPPATISPRARRVGLSSRPNGRLNDREAVIADLCNNGIGSGRFDDAGGERVTKILSLTKGPLSSWIGFRASISTTSAARRPRCRPSRSGVGLIQLSTSNRWFGSLVSGSWRSYAAKRFFCGSSGVDDLGQIAHAAKAEHRHDDAEHGPTPSSDRRVPIILRPAIPISRVEQAGPLRRKDGDGEP